MKRPALRIASLLPSTTEIVAALGLADALVGITHECDYPAGVLDAVPVVTSTSMPSPHALTQAAINETVWRSVLTGHSLYGLDAAALAAARPNVVLTQALCDVCAVPAGLVGTALQQELPPTVVSLEPTTLESVVDTIGAVGAACAPYRPEAEGAARDLATQCRDDLGHIHAAVMAMQCTAQWEGGQGLASAGPPDQKRVAFLEWHDPLFTGGHWIPDMLRIAGAEYGMCDAGERSVPWSAAQVRYCSACL